MTNHVIQKNVFQVLVFCHQIRKSIQQNDDFQIIFKYLPKISSYQIVIVLIASYSEIVAGALQLAQIILQAPPGDLKVLVEKFSFFLDSQICIESRSTELNLTQDGCDSFSSCIAYNYSSQAC